MRTLRKVLSFLFAALVGGHSIFVATAQQVLAPEGTILNSPHNYTWDRMTIINVSSGQSVPFITYQFNTLFAPAGVYTITMNTVGFAGAINIYSFFDPTTPNANFYDDGVVASAPGTISKTVFLPQSQFFEVVFSAASAGASGVFSATISGPGAVAINPPTSSISIRQQPKDQTVEYNHAARLSVYAGGPLPQTWQWYAGVKGDTSNPIPGATGETYTTPPLTSDANYWVQLTGPAGTTGANPKNSETAEITVTANPGAAFSGILSTGGCALPDGSPFTVQKFHIQQQGNYTFTVTPGFTLNTYQGVFDSLHPELNKWSETVNGFYTESDFELVISKIGGGAYSGAIAGPAVVNLQDPLPPMFLSNPQDTTIQPGASATLAVSMTCGTPFTLQWYQGNSGDTSNPMAGATGQSFTTPALFADTSYWVRMSYAGGHVDSGTALIFATAGPITYSGVLTDCDRTFNRPAIEGEAADAGGLTGKSCAYKTFIFRVSQSGAYHFSIATSGVQARAFLYQSIFSPTNPRLNLYDVSPLSGNPLEFPSTLLAIGTGKYYLVITSENPGDEGTFTVTVGGPALVTKTPAPVITVQPMSTNMYLKLPPAAPPQGLVRWWRAEGNSVDTVTGLAASLQGGVSFAPGKVGQSFSLAGNGQHIVGDANPALDTPDATIEAWVKPDWAPNVPGYNPAVLSMRAPGQTRYSLHIHQDYSGIALYIGSVVYTFPATLARGQWHHIAIVEGGGVMICYLNGAQIGVRAGVFGNATGMPFCIGAAGAGGGEWFQGQIDEVSVYNRALYFAEVERIYASAANGKLLPGAVAPYPAPAGLKGWWRAEGDANDSAGGNSGILGNGAAFVPGKAGQAFGFDGVNQFVQVENLPAGHLGNELTFEAWVYPQSASCNTILSRGDGINGATTDYIFSVGFDGATCGAMKVALFVAGRWDSSASNVPLNAWTHVAATFDGAQTRFYIKGALDRVVPHTGTVYQSGGPLFIGRQGAACNCNLFHGRIDEVSIYNRPLSAAEIAGIYAAGSSGKAEVAVTDSVTFSVASSSAGVSYQWYTGDDCGNKLPISGATGTSYTTPPLTGYKSYWVELTNPGGYVFTESATVRIIPMASNHHKVVAEDTAVTIPAPGLFANSVKAPERTLTVVNLVQPVHGEVIVAADGSYTYTPVDPLTFLAGDLLDVPILNNGLLFGSSSIAHYLRSRFSTLTLSYMNGYCTEFVDCVSLQTLTEALLGEFNAIVLGESIYSVERFGLASLRPETVALVTRDSQQGWTSWDTQRLNRFLLEDIAPTHFSRIRHPANYFGPDSFLYQLSDETLTSGVAIVHLTVAPTADTPSVTEASLQTMVIRRSPVDGEEVSHFKIPAIFNGTLFLNDGITPVHGGAFITAAQGAAGLKFTPTPGLYSPGFRFGFNIQASVSNGDASLHGSVVSANITVQAQVNPVAGLDVITRAANADTKVSIATLLANDVDPLGGAVSLVAVNSPSAGGATVTLTGSWIYYFHSGTNADSFTYTIQVPDGRAATGTVQVNIQEPDAESSNQLSIRLVGPAANISFNGIPGRIYLIQSKDGLQQAWQDRTNAVEASAGAFIFNDPEAAPSRFYRSVFR